MRKILLPTIVGFSLFAFSAFAQTPEASPVEPQLATYRQLLAEANDRLANASVQISKQDVQIKTLTKELDELKKAKADKPAEAIKPK